MNPSKMQNLRAIAEHISKDQPGLTNTIIKELLHHDILRAIQSTPLANSLVFQGGTALRLVYRSDRFSEDLDFVHSDPLNPAAFDTLKKTLVKSIEEKYGLTLAVSNPKLPLDVITTPDRVAVHRWSAKVVVESPLITEKQKQVINIEVANIPAIEARPSVIQNHYETQLGAQSPIVISTSSEREILADKLVAVAGRDYLKARDLWDINWLKNRGVTTHNHWILEKASHYNIATPNNPQAFLDALSNKCDQILSPENVRKFKDEMSRFLNKEQTETWLSDNAITQSLLAGVQDYLGQRMELITQEINLSG
jgi:predicted nucleotidyltransferase component of viral defense system